ncbi:hypothetical protein Taro_027039 [Colocasia esculenta]|uniref:Uncharacterized protein n=1 Tax=Colocasia esculenta TaxID=4460 RepID=A0A843VMG7_COLES|nr:hypothetical protein [Colocasia esculenta]
MLQQGSTNSFELAVCRLSSLPTHQFSMTLPTQLAADSAAWPTQQPADSLRTIDLKTFDSRRQNTCCHFGGWHACAMQIADASLVTIASVAFDGIWISNMHP